MKSCKLIAVGGFTLLLAFILTACGQVVVGNSEKPNDLSLSGHVYSLPKAFARIEMSRAKSGEVVTETFKVGKLIFASDERHTYSLHHIKNVLFDDHVIFKTTASGLLDEVSVTTTDRTRDIVKKILELVEGVAKLSAASVVLGEKEKKAGDPLFNLVATIDPTNQSDINRVNERLKRLGENKLSLRMRRIVPTWASGKYQANQEQTAKCMAEICYRIAVPYVLEMMKVHPTGQKAAVVSEMVVVPDPYVIASIKVRRGMFVKKVTKLDFSNGILVGTDINYPSELKGFIDIPVDIVNTLVALPSAILDFKITNKQDDTKLINAQRSQIEAEQKLIEAQKELLEKQAEANSIACLPGDPNC